MPQHVVVDGSNIATEGRSLPSLAQLNEAVMAFMAEYPEALITVVVDATFGHRIDPKETAEFDEAIANNELVAPPAGAVGRGDAFVLSIANKVNATILTNDSYQEFHGKVDWLFDEGRLIGGKPVPHVGWVFVPRLPVRGAVSRSAVKDAKRKRGGAAKAPATVRQGSAAANQPMPVPKTPPPSAKAVATATTAAAKAEVMTAPAEVVAAASATPKAVAVNDFLPFLAFVEHHPVGSSVNAVVENYSSHGAYVRVGDVKGYVPLRLMADPAPRSAREFMKIGDAVTLVVESFAPARRSIDLAVAGMSTAKPIEPPPVKPPRSRKKAVAEPSAEVLVEDDGSVTKPQPSKSGRAAKTSTARGAAKASKTTKASGTTAAKAAGTTATKAAPRRSATKVADTGGALEMTPAADVVETPSDATPATKPARRPTKKAASSTAKQPSKQPAKRGSKKAAASSTQPAKRAPAKAVAVPAADEVAPAASVDHDDGPGTSTDAPPARRRRRVH
jgi:hypothetical protein